MSVRSELIRLGLRAFKDGNPDPDIVALRRQFQRLERLVPRPPAHASETRLDVAGLPAVRVSTVRSRPDRCVLHLHGGAFVCGSPALYRDFHWRIADATEAFTLCIDYRLAPEHPFPAAIDDAAAAYRALLDQGIAPRKIAIMGDSAGGGLAFGALLKLRDEQAPMPAAAVGLSPWADLSLSGASYQRNAAADPMLDVAQTRTFAGHYLGGADPKNPYASPVYGHAAGLPPSLIQVGSDEILRDDAERLAQSFRKAQRPVALEVWPRMPHAWHLFSRIMPEGKRAIARVGDFVRTAFAA